MNRRAVCGVLDTKILVAASHAFAVHFSGAVIWMISSHRGTVGKILNALGSFPDLYLDNNKPILS